MAKRKTKLQQAEEYAGDAVPVVGHHSVGGRRDSIVVYAEVKLAWLAGYAAAQRDACKAKEPGK